MKHALRAQHCVSLKQIGFSSGRNPGRHAIEDLSYCIAYMPVCNRGTAPRHTAAGGRDRGHIIQSVNILPDSQYVAHMLVGNNTLPQGNPGHVPNALELPMSCHSSTENASVPRDISKKKTHAATLLERTRHKKSPMQGKGII